LTRFARQLVKWFEKKTVFSVTPQTHSPDSNEKPGGGKAYFFLLKKSDQDLDSNRDLRLEKRAFCRGLEVDSWIKLLISKVTILNQNPHFKPFIASDIKYGSVFKNQILSLDSG
jgi:hypothetical protein